MNQELMTLDFWQDTVIYEGKTLPVGALACDALNVPADTIAKMNEQCEKINLLLGILNAGQDASALCPIASSRLIFSHCSFIFAMVFTGTFSASQASVPTGNVLLSYMTVSCQKSNVINS